MSLNSMLSIFLPKDKVFFTLFEKVATTVGEMGDLMTQIVNENDYSQRAALIAKLEQMEHRNDEHTHQIFQELGKNFITPFDREDIHYLAIALDDICDYIYASGKKINFYKVNPNDNGIRKMAEIIRQGSHEVKAAVYELRNMKNVKRISDSIIKINSFENQADDVFDMCIERLFDMETDVKELIKKREIYQVMEIVTDKFEDAANVMDSILVKYA
jgi:predicted phosphate transport protein (TIGR00153 family)